MRLVHIVGNKHHEPTQSYTKPTPIPSSLPSSNAIVAAHTTPKCYRSLPYTVVPVDLSHLGSKHHPSTQEEAWIPRYSVPDHQLSVTSYHSRPNLSHFESRMTFDCRGLNPRQSVRKYVRRLCHILFSRKLRLKPRANCRQNRGKPRATPGKLRAQALKKRGHAIQNRCRTAFFRGKPLQDRAKPRIPRQTAPEWRQTAPKPRQNRAKPGQTAPNCAKPRQTAPRQNSRQTATWGQNREEAMSLFLTTSSPLLFIALSNSFVMVSRGASKTKDFITNPYL